MYCPSCGHGNRKGGLFCEACGKRLPTSADFTPVPETPAVDTPAGATLSGGRTQVASPGRPLEAGDVFHERYRIEKVIGEGGMGFVYRAHDDLIGEAICLKVVRPELVASGTMAKRFLREGAVTRGLRHRNIVAVFDVNAAAGRLYMTMEYLEGRTLRKWMKKHVSRHGEVAVPMAVRLVREIVAGLSAAHRAGVVHRDLKPENVMITRDPHTGKSRVKVLDFGIARAFHKGDQLTVVGSSMGTPAYMAPEQELSADSVGPEADLYSLAAILYELLVGAPPRGRWEMPSAVRTDLSSAFDDFMRKALQARPALRFKSARDFERALDAALETAVPVEEEVPPTLTPLPEPPPPPPAAKPSKPSKPPKPPKPPKARKTKKPGTEKPAPPKPRERSASILPAPPAVPAPPPGTMPAPPPVAAKRPPGSFGIGRAMAVCLLNAICLGLGVAVFRVLQQPLVRILWRLDLDIDYRLLAAIPLIVGAVVTIVAATTVGRRLVPGFGGGHAFALLLVYGGAFVAVHFILVRRGYHGGAGVWMAVLAAAGLLLTVWQIRIGWSRAGR